jgi:hypothetical protein
MGKSLFGSKCNKSVGFFTNTDTNVNYSTGSYIPVINTTGYDFNIKIKQISILLNHVVYHDYNTSLDTLKREYNNLIYELNKLKISLNKSYPVILNNVITTFDTLLKIYQKYITGIHEDNIILPDITYDNISGLELFIDSLRQEIIPLIYQDRYNQELELVLYKLYKNIGNDLEKLLTLYSTGNFTELKDELTYEVYSKLSVLLFNESFEDSFGYTKVWEVLNSSLEGLYKTVLLEKAHQDEILLLKSKIKLLETKDSQEPLLEGIATMTEIGQVRSEIKIYIATYGFPVGGVFDTVKLAEIIKKLG